VSTPDEKKEATAHVDLHDKPGGLHPLLKRLVGKIERLERESLQ
jgi:hypothetical protein